MTVINSQESNDLPLKKVSLVPHENATESAAPNDNWKKIQMSVTGRNKEMTAKQRLRAHLMQDYDKSIHPLEDHRDTVNVSLGMALIHMDLDEKKSLIIVDGWMRLTWNDPNLSWNPDLFDNVTLMHFGAEEIWRPDILLYNNADEANVEHYGKTHLLVDKDGEVLWVPPGHFKAYCRYYSVLILARILDSQKRGFFF